MHPLQTKVNELIERGREIKESCPNFKSISFKLDNLEYKDMAEAYPNHKLEYCQGQVFFILYDEPGMDIAVILWSKPVQIRTTIEVIEPCTQPS